MRKTSAFILSIAVPVVALAASGLSGLVERVPTLPGNARQLAVDLSRIETAAAALTRDIDAMQAAVDREFASNATAAQAAHRAQVRAMTGMSDEELDAADDDAVADRLLAQMGLDGEDLDEIEAMDDDEGAAWLARKAAGSQGLARMTAPAGTSGADAARVERLLTEAGERARKHSEDVERASRAYAALNAEIDRDHAQLDARLDTEQAPRKNAVRMVDCGEEGEYPDARAIHALDLERARAHVALLPGHLTRASAHLDQRRKVARDHAAFAERMRAEAGGVPVAAGQVGSSATLALGATRNLLIETTTLARKIADWESRLQSLERNPPKGSCG
jgi:hypothetical protein